ncbi:PilN domain-containing protein [Geobacter pelophilus]|uniref:PilN domain-containing protein n=1 Tax=Geoanaerobacter pelophilus TaxID=60036 RepID=A0AAW4L9A3_9BACT|nr:PilN domain-containing protein [Geoanaerobacter pelophilus]MBT0665633.1 PilN domain-containing protein [Geoanaerobacter pelophilus]
MVRINLLPVRTNKKKETAKQQVLIFALVVAGCLVACISVYSLTLAKIAATKQEIGKSEKEIAILKTKIGEIDNIKKLQDEVRRKLDVLNQLRKNKTGPASRLAHICDAIPEKVWLTKYVESSAATSLAGVAYNEELIAELMRNLMATGDFSNVELQVSEQYEVVGVKAKRFELICTLKPVQSIAPKDGGAPKK